MNLSPILNARQYGVKTKMRLRDAEKIYFKETYKVLDSPFIKDARKVELMSQLLQELKEQVPFKEHFEDKLKIMEIPEVRYNLKLKGVLECFYEEGFGWKLDDD